MYRIGDIVYYNKISDEDYVWELIPFERYKIDNRAFSKEGEEYYSVRNNNNVLCWYNPIDFISELEMRKIKIDRIRNVK